MRRCTRTDRIGPRGQRVTMSDNMWRKKSNVRQATRIDDGRPAGTLGAARILGQVCAALFGWLLSLGARIAL